VSAALRSLLEAVRLPLDGNERWVIPAGWAALVSEINGGRICDGEPGIRDVDAPCEEFEPGEPGRGDCQTDGHYMCSECIHVDLRVLRERQDRCEDTGEKLTVCKCNECCKMRATGDNAYASL
jgi:hypothetical protein